MSPAKAPEPSKSEPSFLDRPRMGWVVALAVFGIGAFLVRTEQLAKTSTMVDQLAESRATLIAQRNRENDKLEARVTYLEHHQCP